MNRLKVTDSEFQALSKYIYGISGITLSAGKEYLIETRLGQLATEYGCRSYQELLTRSRTEASRALEKKIIDAISTNETYFFRDNAPFNLLQHRLIPDIIDRKSKKGGRVTIRIWSSASSTGQEIYSTAMVLRELGLPKPGCDLQLIATDISDAAIARASYGLYSQFEVTRGLSPARLAKYFTPKGDGYRINDEIRSMVSFRKQNLLTSLTGLGKFDIILCRNVAIYFTREDRLRLFDNLSRQLEPDGCLLIGSTESLAQEESPFVPMRYLNSTFYQLQDTAPSAPARMNPLRAING
ncbi:CheR family methyltransferase [Desulfoluna spongiiphila]|uniref:protein-glutamate O-methyltransferase n=1 Tax=Desulfoluna spongiiphila TaxID=419481 RepID=A0A1G5BUZ8_9BACT|nr:protein-glutamate O-methyltransferase CheR [Desulfoluna spongiiphila]SCX94035.1 chemotaxis protein methyltransferase CheR [Desulfoluna spongiiphila]VVS93933.1 mcp methyltransferase cher-type [Desulfoluna spongiiphila]